MPVQDAGGAAAPTPADDDAAALPSAEAAGPVGEAARKGDGPGEAAGESGAEASGGKEDAEKEEGSREEGEEKEGKEGAGADPTLTYCCCNVSDPNCACCCGTVSHEAWCLVTKRGVCWGLEVSRNTLWQHVKMPEVTRQSYQDS